MATKKKAKAKKKAPAKKPVKRAAKPARPKHPQVVHWEVQARDPSRQVEFFSSLFGWTIDTNNPMNYGMVTSSGVPKSIDGGIGATQDSPRVTVYIQVPSIDDVLQRAQTLGAQTVMPRTDLGMVIMGQFRDPEGNIIGIIEG
jgi:predicted enzyme related to lactoylglutathione lyase